MADQAKPTVPEVPAPTEERYGDGSLIKKGAQSTEFWSTEAKALEIAAGRTKGARKAFVIKDKAGKVRYATATHHHYLEEYLLTVELGWEVTEVGKIAASKVPVTATGVLAAIDALPEAERDAVKKQLEALLGTKAKK